MCCLLGETRAPKLRLSLWQVPIAGSLSTESSVSELLDILRLNYMLIHAAPTMLEGLGAGSLRMIHIELRDEFGSRPCPAITGWRLSDFVESPSFVLVVHSTVTDGPSPADMDVYRYLHDLGSAQVSTLVALCGFRVLTQCCPGRKWPGCSVDLSGQTYSPALGSTSPSVVRWV